MKKFLVALIISLFAVSGLTACSTNGIQTGSAIRIAELNGFNSINGDNVTEDGSLAVNQQIASLLDPSFYYFDSSGQLVPNTNFGSVKVLSKQPFKVKYSLAGNAKWSDGQAVSADDLLLSWLAARNPLDSGFNSSRSGSGLSHTSSIPDIATDSKSITVTFDHPVSDYRTSLTINAAAHVVAEQAFSLADPATALQRFESAVTDANLDDQKLIANQYSQVYLAKNLGNPGAKIGSGPYLFEAFGSKLLLKANPNFSWGPLPKIDSIQISFFSDAPAIMAAMQGGLVDIAAPQESGIATVSDLVGLAKSAGVTLKVGGSTDIESVLLNFAKGSAFASAGADPTKTVAIRSSFLKLVPIAKILTALSSVSPVIEAKSWIYSSTSKYYTPFVQSNGSADFAMQNAEQAQELLKSNNVRTPVDVRVLYDSNNPRSKTEFSLLGQYAHNVGFNLIDISTKTPRDVYTTGAFDVFITTSSLAGEAGGDPYWFTGRSVTGFADPNLDSLLAQLSAKTEEIDRVSVLKQIDAELYKAQFGLPLYQVPSMLAYSKKVKSIVESPLGSSATYGYWNWAVSN